MRFSMSLACCAVLCLTLSRLQGQEKTYQSSFYPLQVGATWTYRVTDKDGKSEERVTVKVEKIETIEADVGKKEKVSAARLEVRSGDRKLTEYVGVLGDGMDGIYRFSSAEKNITPALCFLKLGDKGKTWQVDSTSDGAKLKGTFTLGKDLVAVPYFKDQKRDTITASCPDFQVGSSKMSVTYWFADKVGIVKQHVKVDNTDRLLELVEYQPGMSEKGK